MKVQSAYSDINKVDNKFYDEYIKLVLRKAIFMKNSSCPIMYGDK